MRYDLDLRQPAIVVIYAAGATAMIRSADAAPVVVEASVVATDISAQLLQEAVLDEPVVLWKGRLNVPGRSRLLPLQGPLRLGFHLQLDRRVIADLFFGDVYGGKSCG